MPRDKGKVKSAFDPILERIPLHAPLVFLNVLLGISQEMAESEFDSTPSVTLAEIREAKEIRSVGERRPLEISRPWLGQPKSLIANLLCNNRFELASSQKSWPGTLPRLLQSLAIFLFG